MAEGRERKKEWGRERARECERVREREYCILIFLVLIVQVLQIEGVPSLSDVVTQATKDLSSPLPGTVFPQYPR